MIMGVLQQLRIIRQDDSCLVLREFPLLEYGFALGLMIGSMSMFMLGLTNSGIGSIVIGVLIVLLSKWRDIIFDHETKQMRVIFRYSYRQRQVMQLDFDAIEDVILQESDTGHTQIVVVTRDGDLGLSVYSNDMRDWKTGVVEAIREQLNL